MKLSVIVPSLTGEVPESLLAQVDGRSDVELVVVTGVSPVGKARNEGLSRATGDYIAWVDADDEVTDDWLSEILRALEGNPDVVVLGYKWMMSADFGFEKIWRGDDLLKDVLKQDVVYGELWNKVIRRGLWDGVRFDDTARTMEDYEVMPGVLAKVRKTVCIVHPVYRYYVRRDGLTHQADESMQNEVFRRALGRVEEVRRLGLWTKYGSVTWVGVMHAVYCCAECLAFAGESDSPTKREAERWLLSRLPLVLISPARRTYKVKWVLAAFGCWRVIRWYYVRIQGRKL